MAEKQGAYYYTKEEVEEKLGYSTEEKACGIWIDGKTLYKKTVDVGSLPDSAVKEVAHNITNLDKLIRLEGCANDSSGTRLPLPYAYTTAASSVAAYVIGDVIRIRTGSDRSSLHGYVTLYYTKTESA